jgi:hypothetical protein
MGMQDRVGWFFVGGALLLAVEAKNVLPIKNHEKEGS